MHPSVISMFSEPLVALLSRKMTLPVALRRIVTFLSFSLSGMPFDELLPAS